MRITEIIVESELQEGPIWDKVKSAGSAVGKGLGAVGQGIGAVASVPQGIGRAIKKGYNAGVDTISGGPDGNAPAQSAPAQTAVGAFKQGFSNAMSGGAPAQSAPAQTAGGPPAQTAGGAQPTPQSIKAQIAAKQKQMKAIQKELDGLNKMLSPKAPAQGQQAPAQQAQAPADAGAGAFGQMAQSLSGQQAPATQNSPVSASNQAPAPAPKRTGGKVAGQVSQTPNAMRKRAARAASKAMATPESLGFHSKFLGMNL
jgi:hypothetical protein